MAHPVTPPPGNWLAESAPPDTCTEPEGWAGLPADLLYRVSALLDSQYDLPCLLATCRSWHCTLKSALVALRIHCLGAPALGTNFSSVRSLDAPLRRRTFFGLTYLAPIGNAEMLSARFPSLVHLNLSGQDFGPHGLSVLRPLAGRLQHLDCSGCEFNRADIAALAHLYQLTSLALNAVRAAPVDQETHPEDLLAKDFVFDVVPRLSQLRHLGLRQGAELFRKPADLAKHYDTVQQVQQQAMQAGEFALQAADLQRLADALSKSRRRFLGLPMRKLVDCLTVLRDLSSLDLSQQYLDTTDLTALASLTRLTALAMTWPFLPAPLPMRSGPWPPKPDSAVVWASLFGGPLGQSLRVLDVDLDNRDEYDRLSLATLRNLRVLRLRNCNTAHLLISLMRPTTGPAAAAALPQPGPAGSHGGGGGRGAGAGGGGGGGGRGGGGGGDAVGLVRLELLKAGKRITPALVAQVCSRLPELRTLNVSDSFKLPARFQLHGDLLIRDLAVLCPWLVQLGLRGVALHGVGFPDGRDLALLPFSGPETTEPRNRTATATAAAPTGSAVGASRSGSAAARAAAAAGAGAGASSSSSMSSSSPSPELVQLPFPRLRSLVVQGGPVVAQGAVVIQGGPVFLKSRFRSLANLRALRHLRIEGMTERDFLATCKMGCYEHLSRLTALTALHIMAPPPPGPPEPLPWQQHQAPAAAAGRSCRTGPRCSGGWWRRRRRRGRPRRFLAAAAGAAPQLHNAAHDTAGAYPGVHGHPRPGVLLPVSAAPPEGAVAGGLHRLVGGRAGLPAAVVHAAAPEPPHAGLCLAGRGRLAPGVLPARHHPLPGGA
ncbi:hypothetical protein PLESTF_001755600 [Pleodorina starrii]|nr:hypothetical protein PLESTF_001755600 [Pleodorina starrii]